MDSKLRDNVLAELLKIQAVREIVEVTGRFDMIVTIAAGALDEMYKLISEKIGRIDGVEKTETFVEMKKTIKEPEYSTLQDKNKIG